jgi:dipeptidyl aminopeptidase/acylaminoacyl peptidase
MRILPLALLVVTLGQAPVRAQETPSDVLLTVGHYLDIERVSDPRISPDGIQVVYTRAYVDKMKDRYESAIWIMSSDGSKNRFLVDGSAPRWSPDGTRIAYLAEGEPGGSQIHVRWMDAEGAVTQVTHEPETPSNHKWAPDGRFIYFQRTVPSRQEFTIDLPAPPQGAEWTAPPRIVDRIHYRFDRIGFLPDGYNHLFRVPSDGGTPQQLTEGDWHVGGGFVAGVGGAGYDISPDGGTLVFDGLMEDADGTYRESHIWAKDLESGAVRQLTRRRGPWSGPVISPDGRSIAFTGYEWTSQSYKSTDVYVIGLDGSGMRLLSGALDRDVGSLRWGADSDGIYFTAGDRGTMNVHHVSLDGDHRQVTDGPHMLGLSSVAGGRTAVGIRSAPHDPPDVVRYSLSGGGEPTRLTRVNDDVLENKRLGEVEEIWYPSSGGAQVQGWVVKPPDFDPDERYPLILHVHGGPHSMYNVGFNYAFQNFAANGYLLLYTNPRGSTGYGTEFGNAIDNGYPSVDYDDLMAGVDAVIDRGWVDENRMYVTGCSGGGVLSSWVIGHTDRFAGAGVRCPVINWMSFAGTADITVWGYYRYEGFPWTNPDKYLEHSPLMYVENVTTPTILMTGELDLRTPMGQTEEYYQALKQVGVPTKLLRFQEEYHGTGSKPSNFMRTQLYLMKWFQQYEKGKPIM